MNVDGLVCPIPITKYPQVQLAHGGGGRLMRSLIHDMFVTAFGEEVAQHDGALLSFEPSMLAFTTDSYVVQPLFFPGGDIGQMAIFGTVNDLAMCGARPLYLSVGMILEEGLSMETLWQVVQSMQRAATRAGVRIVTGDTKVVDKGKGDGLFINTAGIGRLESPTPIGPEQIRSGDVIILSGDVGRHGMAIMAAREGLDFESTVESDLAPLAEPVLKMLAEGVEIHCMRDLTRGGLASALVEIADGSRQSIHIRERDIPVREEVRGACELLGLDPMYVANEGRFVAFVPVQDAEYALSIIRSCGHDAVLIGEVQAKQNAMVTMTSLIGIDRIVDLLSGEQLPRIC
ncbi:MAG: hydrogenase expression/formation protein HypE [Anaerolineae bacterium]|nr:hydrogenase expression/formation protein HypE [Anaerolineae bacterium]